MKHFTSKRFWRCFESLPIEIQNLARQNYHQLKRNPAHPSLRFKLVANGRFRSVRVGIKFRALGVPVPDGVQWFWIGDHTEYEKTIGAK